MAEGKIAYVPDDAPGHAGLGLLPRSVGERVQQHRVDLLDARATTVGPSVSTLAAVVDRIAVGLASPDYS